MLELVVLAVVVLVVLVLVLLAVVPLVVFVVEPPLLEHGPETQVTVIHVEIEAGS